MRLRFHIAAAVVATLVALPAAAARYDVPLFISGANNASGQQGFVRVVNHTDQAGTVTVRAWDDNGVAFGADDTDVLTLRPWQAKHFNSNDLEMGNVPKGFSGIGTGTGDWRLQIESDLTLEVLAYVQSSDGFLTAIDSEARQPGVWQLVPIFNPGSNTRQVSKLRLINPDDAPASITIVGVDDTGATYRAAAQVEAKRAMTISAQQLESGAGLRNGEGLGDGAGKWRLHVGSDKPISVMSLLETSTGRITSLAYSTSHVDPSLPQQIAPPRASSGFPLGSGWRSYRIAYANGEFVVPLLGVCPVFGTCWSLGTLRDALGQWVSTVLFHPGWGKDSIRGLTYGKGVLYLSNYTRRSIRVHSVLGGGDESRTIELPWPPYELAYGQGKLFVVTWVRIDGTSKAEVRQLTLGGEEAGASFPLSSRNENPTGMTYWGDHLYVVDEEKEQVFVYSTESGERERSLEFELDPENDHPQGIEYANGRFYVPDTGDDRVYAYTSSGDPVVTEFPLALGGTLNAPSAR